VLDRIVGAIAVAKHELDDVEEVPDRLGRKDRERIAIAPARLLDQVSPHGSPHVVGRGTAFAL
jgi:hypothetical protein